MLQKADGAWLVPLWGWRESLTSLEGGVTVDFAVRLNWIDRVYANGKGWNAVAETLFTSDKGRQGFVAASFAAEEFAKAFVLWYLLGTQRENPPGLRCHAVKQILGGLLATINDAPDAEYHFDGLLNRPMKYLDEVDDEGWEEERRNAVYEEEGGLPDFSAGYVSGVALELEACVGRLVELTKSTNRFDQGTLAQHFATAFELDV